MPKIIADVYYKPNSSSTKKIASFIGQNEGIMNRYFFRFKNVTRQHVKAEAKKYGIKAVPSMVIEGVLYSGADPIIKKLGGDNATTVRHRQEQPISHEDMLNKFMMREAMTPDDEDDDITEGMNNDEIRRKVSALSSKKPHCKAKESMSGQSSRSRSTTPNRIPKKRPGVKTRRPVENDDDAFLRKAGRDNIDPRGDMTDATPYPIEDGEALLEKYYASVGSDMSM